MGGKEKEKEKRNGKEMPLKETKFLDLVVLLPVLVTP